MKRRWGRGEGSGGCCCERSGLGGGVVVAVVVVAIVVGIVCVLYLIRDGRTSYGSMRQTCIARGQMFDKSIVCLHRPHFPGKDRINSRWGQQRRLDQRRRQQRCSRRRSRRCRRRHRVTRRGDASEPTRGVQFDLPFIIRDTFDPFLLRIRCDG